MSWMQEKIIRAYAERISAMNDQERAALVKTLARLGNLVEVEVSIDTIAAALQDLLKQLG